MEEAIKFNDSAEDPTTQTLIQNSYCFWYMRRQSAASKGVSARIENIYR